MAICQNISIIHIVAFNASSLKVAEENDSFEPDLSSPPSLFGVFCVFFIIFLNNIYIKFGNKLYRQIVGLPMGINCAPLVADLFLFCYERNFMTSLSGDNQADIIEGFKSTSRCLDDLLNIDNPYFEGMVNQIYPPELQLNKVNTSDTEAPFLDLHLSISNGFVSSKMFDKRDDFEFDIVNFPFLDVDVLRRPSYSVYFSVHKIC